jgi:hypothetical protein
MTFGINLVFFGLVFFGFLVALLAAKSGTPVRENPIQKKRRACSGRQLAFRCLRIKLKLQQSREIRPCARRFENASAMARNLMGRKSVYRPSLQRQTTA